jgi:dCMP deaminase
MLEKHITHHHNIDKKAFLYLDLVDRIAEESYCVRLQVGSLIVKDDNIISFGYNGTAKGALNTCEEKIEDELVTLRTVIHSESNSITKACKSPISTEGSTMYCTHSCCIDCAKLIIQSGINRFIYKHDYRDTSGIEFLLESGIQVLKENQESKKLEILTKK